MQTIYNFAICTEGIDRDYAGWVADILAERVQQRFGVQASHIASAADAGDRLLVTLCETGGEGERFRISTAGSHVRVEGASTGLLFGVGKLLRSMRREKHGVDFPSLNVAETPAVAMRGVFHPILYWHGRPFNAYSALCLDEERFDDFEAYLIELMLWGMNTLGLWYAESMPQPGEGEEGQRIWKRYQRILAIANKLRLKISLLCTINLAPEGEDVRSPHLAAPRGPQGLWLDQPGKPSNTFCLTQPEGRARLREIRRRLFELFSPIAVEIFPTDPGGCGCPSCTPYAPAYFSLAEEMLADAAACGVPLRGINAWFFFNKEARQLAQLAAASEHVNYLSVQAAGLNSGTIGYESTAERMQLIHDAAPDLPLVYWPDITMEGNWGITGSYPYAGGIRSLFTSGGAPYGVMPYSEGRYDDLNKFFMLSLAWNPRQTLAHLTDETLDETFGEQLPREVHRAVALMERHHISEARALFEAAESLVSAEVRQSMLWISLRFYTRHGDIFIKEQERNRLRAATERLKVRPSRQAAFALRRRLDRLRARVQKMVEGLPALADLVNGLSSSDNIRCGTRAYSQQYLEEALGFPEAKKALAEFQGNRQPATGGDAIESEEGAVNLLKVPEVMELA